MNKRIPYSAGGAQRNSKSGILGVNHYKTTRTLPSGNIQCMRAWEATFRIRDKMIKKRYYYGRDRTSEEALSLAKKIRSAVVEGYRKRGYRGAENAYRKFLKKAAI